MPSAVLDPGEQDGLAVDAAAAGLKTALTGYGQSSAVRIGLPGWRLEELARRSRCRRLESGLADGGADAGGVEEERGAMEGERRLGALVLVQRLAAEPVAAAAGREVVERLLQAVASEEPLERARRPDAVLGLAR